MATRALITGAGGLIGSWVLRHGRASAIEILPLARAEEDLLAPGAPERLLERLRPDAVVHLAWCASGRSGYRHSEENARWVEASVDLATACAERDVDLWLTGSVVDTAAGTDSGGLDAYARSKVDLRARLSGDIATGRLGWLRPHYVFDEVAARPALVAQTLASRSRNAPLELRTPHSVHDFVHASDVGSAVVHALEHRITGEVPIGSGTTRSVSELVECLGGRWRAADVLDDAGTSHAEVAADVSSLRRVGWAPNRTDATFAWGPLASRDAT